MTITYSSVQCFEVPNTLSIDFDAVTGDIVASVQLNCAWNNRWLLVADLLNNSRVLPSYGVGAPVALKAAVVPEGAHVTLGQGLVWDMAKVTVSYGHKKFEQIGPYDIVSESLEPMAEFKRLPWQNFRWGSKTGTPIIQDEAPGKLEVKLNLVRQIFKVPTPLDPLVLTAAGKCNDAAYTSNLLGLTFEPETLLYLEPKFERSIRNDGSDGVNYTQTWSFKPTSWNKFWRAESNDHEYMYQTTDAGTDPFKPYEPIDLSALLA